MKHLINAHTKISTLLKQHPDALETIVSLSPDFKKLRNPILRRLMAGRTTIAMASKIGGCRPSDFFQALAPLGFEIEDKEIDHLKGNQKLESIMPEFLQNMPPSKVQRFDVRTLLEQGEDPLKAIQQKAKAIAPGQALLLINSFEPVPLIKLLSRQGFQVFVRTVDADTVETYLYKIEGQHSDLSTGPEQDKGVESTDDWQSVYARFEKDLLPLDVRSLEMPLPMMTILENLDTMPSNKALYVQHKRIPVFLLTELKERGFDFRIHEVQDDEVYLLIFKESTDL